MQTCFENPKEDKYIISSKSVEPFARTSKLKLIHSKKCACFVDHGVLYSIYIVCCGGCVYERKIGIFSFFHNLFRQ